MDLLCDFNIPDSLTNSLQRQGNNTVKEADDVLATPTNSEKSDYATDNDLVLLTDDHRFLQKSLSHGVILYADPSLKNNRAIRLIEKIRKHNNGQYSNISASIP